MKSKSDLRHDFLLARRTIKSGLRQPWDTTIQNRVLALPKLAAAPIVLAHVGIAPEVDTRSILVALLARGATVLAPIMSTDDDAMHWGRVDSLDTLVQGPYGIVQPPDSAAAPAPPDAPVLVPCVAFTGTCERLGRGGGHFDRFLQSHAGPKIGLAYDCQRAETIPIEPHDIPLDMIVTEAQTYSS